MPDSDPDTKSTERVKPPKQQCSFFLKTGSCAFGDQCKFEHPADTPLPKFNSLGLPLREGEPECAYYVKNLHCGYGASCKFHHAEPVMGWVAMPSAIPSHARAALAQLPDFSRRAAGPGPPSPLTHPAAHSALDQQRMNAMNQAISMQNYQYGMAMMHQPLLANQYGMGVGMGVATSRTATVMPLGYPHFPAMMPPHYPQMQPRVPAAMTRPSEQNPPSQMMSEMSLDESGRRRALTLSQLDTRDTRVEGGRHGPVRLRRSSVSGELGRTWQKLEQTSGTHNQR